jgi:hypothetical protein
MGLIPDTKIGRIQFYQSKITPWTTNAVAIGTTAAAVTDLGTKADAAATKLDAQIAAQEAAKTATLAADNAVSALMVAGAAIIKNIRAKAETTGASVYELAEIPPPATPTPIGPLGTPGDFNVALSVTGALQLKWKCTNPVGATGTIYQIFRRIGAAGEFVYIGGSGAKTFTDATVPAGSSQVAYQLQAVRSTSVGPFAQFNVNFGVSSGGQMTASVTEAPATPPAKIAA